MVTLSPVFIRPLQATPLQTFLPQDLQTDQACSTDSTSEHNDLFVQNETEHVTPNQPETQPSP